MIVINQIKKIMKKILLTTTFVLVSFGAFAANNHVKPNNSIVTTKNNVKIVNISNKNLNVYLKVPASCDANIDTGLFTIIIVWCC
jgi:hypothetical protein